MAERERERRTYTSAKKQTKKQTGLQTCFNELVECPADFLVEVRVAVVDVVYVGVLTVSYGPM